MATVRPLGDRVLVRVEERARVSAGGVVLPDTVRETSDKGEVLAVGPGLPFDGAPPMMRLAAVRMVGTAAAFESGDPLPEIEDEPEVQPMLRPLGVKVGEIVLFSPYAGSKVVVDGDEFLLLRENDVLGVVEGDIPF